MSRFFNRKSIAFVLVALALVAGFIGSFAIRGSSHAAGSSAHASSSTQTKGTVALAGSLNWNQLKTTKATGTVTPQHKFEVNRMGVNNKVSSSASNAPSVTATLMGAATTSQSKKTSNVGKLLQSFDGVSDLDNVTQGVILTPPDQGLCVGPLAVAGQTVVFEPVNISMKVFGTHGNDLAGGAIPLYILFNEPAPEFISDPRCQFDKATGDFFFIALAIDSSFAASHFDVTVVHQSGSASNYKFDTTDLSGRGCPCFGDQPLLGIDKYNLYVSNNEFPIAVSSIFNGAEVYAISKSQLNAGAGVNFAEISNISDQGILIETLQPAITYDANAPAEYLLHSFTVDVNGANNSFDHRLGVFAITNQAAVTAGGFPTLSNPTVINSEPYAQPNLALQPDNSLVLNPDDDRMQQVEYINGNLMGAFSTAVSVKGDTITRDGAAWFDIEPSLNGSLTVNAKIKNQGYIAASGLYILYPAILQSKDGNVLMSFSITNSTTNPSAAYAIVPDGTHSSNAGVIKVAATGNGSYFDNFSCSATLPPGCRWGDYSWATLDPNSNNIWMGSEYIPPVTRQFPDANWGTRVYEVGA
jgi:hypothetical protein